MTLRHIPALFTVSALSAMAQRRSFHQQTEYKGQEIGKLNSLP